MKRLYIDFDGVVMDTIPELYDALEKSGTDVSNHREISIFFSTLYPHENNPCILDPFKSMVKSEHPNAQTLMQITNFKIMLGHHPMYSECILIFGKCSAGSVYHKQTNC